MYRGSKKRVIQSLTVICLIKKVSFKVLNDSTLILKECEWLGIILKSFRISRGPLFLKQRIHFLKHDTYILLALP